MINERLSFKELKDRVSIVDVATYLGYQFDRSKGIAQPSFVLTGGGGEVIDRIYIKNPKENSKQGYWRREGINTTGDVIKFVSENLDKFKDHGRNDLDKINKVLHRFAGKEYLCEEAKIYHAHSANAQTFDPDRWQSTISPQVRDKILSARNINSVTSLTFSKFIDTIQDKNQGGKYTYIGFPYVIPGKDSDIVGYEIRGVNGFKSKATGTNSSEGLWLASFTDNPKEVKNIYIFESAFDALAFAQIYRDRIDLKSSAFVSVGGSFSDKQLIGLSQAYPAARAVLLFDKDLNGHMYDIRAIGLMSGVSIQAKVDKDKVAFTTKERSFSIPIEELSAKKFSELSGISIPKEQLYIHKPQGAFKDWNEILMSPPPPSNKYEKKI